MMHEVLVCEVHRESLTPIVLRDVDSGLQEILALDMHIMSSRLCQCESLTQIEVFV